NMVSMLLFVPANGDKVRRNIKVVGYTTKNSEFGLVLTPWRGHGEYPIQDVGLVIASILWSLFSGPVFTLVIRWSGVRNTGYMRRYSAALMQNLAGARCLTITLIGSLLSGT
ncbi:hypothetical protein AJ79_05163, partial [Helicocarpus griseus UAMH5409]